MTSKATTPKATFVWPATVKKEIREKLDSLVVPPSALPESTQLSLSFRDRKEALQTVTNATIPWSPPNGDQSVPKNVAQRREYVLRLLAAILNRGDCQNLSGGKPRWKREQHYSLQAVEKVCWDIEV
jgi:hypothetical protein